MAQGEGTQVAEAQIAQSIATTTEVPRWNMATRIAFRLIFAYEILYSFPYPLSLLPWSDKVFGWYNTLFVKMTLWTGDHVLHLNKSLAHSFNGSGDSLFSWVQNLVMLMIAVAAAVVWTLLDRKRTNYRAMQEWLWLYVRIVLGATLMAYGSFKVIKTQFPDLFLWRLLEPYGDSSPMGLLWTFMGYSKTYNMFTGLVEFVGGALLFVPRLTTLAALISIGAMGNVFILNMSYDVPVKIYSFNLLLMGVYLIAPEGRRLLNVFVLNRTAEPVVHPPLFRKKWLNWAMLGLQLALLVYLGSTQLYQSYKRYIETGDGSPKPPYYGFYNVDEFVVDGQVHPPVFSDEARWRRVTFDRFNLVGVVLAGGPVQRYRIKLDQSKKNLELTKSGDDTWKAKFTLEQPSPDMLTLNGEMDGKKIQAKLHKVDLKGFLLYDRGFHWINDSPYNR
ncbi:MAG: DoxX family protein [Acidobacteriia bacterium]|nr:DoxX family protein [Terriglobia bacterium]